MTAEQRVALLTERTHKVAQELEQARHELRQAVREARAEGATGPQLMAWTGYSRRMVWYMLKDTEQVE